MALFGFGKKKEKTQASSQPSSSPKMATSAPKIITRDSEYGAIIDFEQKQDLPRDSRMLYRTGLAYWKGAFGPHLKANMDVCRRYAVRSFNAIYYFGLQDQCPEAGFYIAKYFFNKSGDVDGVTIDYKACAAHMCRHYILNGPEVNHMQEPIILYLYHHPDGMEQVIRWLRERVEKDKRQGADPVGLILLRHYLVLRRVAVETTFPYDPAPYEHFAQKYLLSEAVVQCVSGHLLYNDIFSSQSVTEQHREWLKNEGRNGNLVAAQILYGVGIDRIPYQYDGAKTNGEGHVWSYGASQYRGYYQQWKQKLPGLQQELAAFGSDWFDREVAKADKKVDLAKQRHEKRQKIAQDYARALYLHACRRTEEALKLMCQVEVSDASFNHKIMQQHGIRVNLSPAASWWISRHSTGLYDRTRPYGFDEQGNFTRLNTPQRRVDAWTYWELWNEADELAEQLHKKPDADGYRRLAVLFGKWSPYWEPLYALSRQIRQAVLVAEGVDGLAPYLLDEPEEDRVCYAKALICDPEVNHGDPEYIETGWLVLANHRYLSGEDDLTEAIEYVDRYFDCQKAFGNSGLSIRYVTQLAAQDNETALHVLGELYQDHEEVNHGKELLKNLGRMFYRRLSKVYETRWETVRTWENLKKVEEFLQEWYQLEYLDREEADSFRVRMICSYGIDRHIISFYPTLTRRDVYESYMSREGREWVKVHLELALEAGYKSVEELYRRMDQEDWDREWARRQEEIDRKKALEEEMARDKERRRQAFNERCDDLERTMDMMNGGSGLTIEEQALTGRKSPMDHLRNQMARDNVPDWLL